MSQWDARAATYGDDYNVSPVRALIHQMALDEVRRVQPRVVVDGGGGLGYLAGEIHDVFPEVGVILVDSSVEMINLARERRKSGRIQCVQSSIERIDYVRTGSVDLYLSTFALHHLPNAAKRHAICEAKRILAPGGSLWIADEIICDPRLRENPDQTLLAMGEVFYPNLSEVELRIKFRDFVEYPEDLTAIADVVMSCGLRPSIEVINRMVAIVKATREHISLT